MEDSRKKKALEEIAEAIRRCRACKKDKIGVGVPGEGSPDADILFLGEAPGKEEAKTGRPFIGRSGKLLREFISAADLKAEDVFITSPVKYLPKHVTPTKAEIAHGRKHLKDQFAVIQPKLVVLLGRTAYAAIFDKSPNFTKERARITKKDGVSYFLTYHPAAPLYSPKLRVELAKDFRKLKRLLKEGTIKR